MSRMMESILAEIRQWEDECIHNVGRDVLLRDVHNFCDRIKAAWKREKAEREALALSVGGMVEASRHKQVGNAAAMREAMELVLKWEHKSYCEHEPQWYEVIKAIEAALSAPPRNCDVGTAEEQENRFREFCRLNESKGKCGLGRYKAKCPAFQGGRNPDCSLWWAQMPYKADTEEGGAE